MSNAFKWLTPALAAAALFCWSYTATSRADDKPATGSISGTVVDANSKAAANIKVHLFNPKDLPHQHGGGGGKGGGKGGGGQNSPATQPAGGGERPTPVAEATTDKDGKFTMDKVPVGDYVIMAGDRSTGQRGHANVTVTAGNTATVSITLEAGKGGGHNGGGGGGGNGGGGGAGNGGGN